MKKDHLRSPEFFLPLSIAIVLFVGLIITISKLTGIQIGKTLIDFQMHDTMFVISYIHFFIGLILFCLMIWLIYRVSEKYFLSKYLNWFHIITTAVVVILLAATFLFPDNFSQARQQYSASTIEKFKTTPVQIAGTFIFLLFLLAQILFVINVVGGFIKKIITK